MSVAFVACSRPQSTSIPAAIAARVRGISVARIVLKFGGTSVADVDRIRQAARHVKREIEAGNQACVVVSAMSGKTNELVAWCRQAAPLHDAREYDAVVASGEQVTAGLMAIVLSEMGIPSRSFAGWQVPIHTDDAHGAARITGIDATELDKRMNEGWVPVITGFQGVSPSGRITTLGRGGSDTSAVAVAAAVGADRCDIYTDVDGVYTTDPRIVPRARRMNRISFEEMLEMASLGAKVLMIRSVELAMAQKVRLVVRSTFDDPEAPQIGPDGAPGVPGTLVCDEDEIMEKQIVSGVTLARGEAKITLRGVKDKPGVAASVFGALADESIVVDMIVQNISDDGAVTDITFTVPDAEYDKAVRTLEKASAIEYEKLAGSKGGAKISVVGVGMRSHAGVAASMFKALADKGINIQLITTSEIKTSVLIDDQYAELAVRALHTYYGLDKPEA
ncbi:aspartate kinase [Devosia enhydra]|uniref:Aspartokinase n=1 Tax=Devosia enhydra TaxID=665118 RepID=A0A1K2I092_9HYPH|nr:aspartate kinase [Devosia enhydra]